MGFLLTIYTVATFLLLNNLTAVSSEQPNIVFIISDDQGYYDFGFQGSEVITPNIDELASSGIMLSNYYVQPLCTPSRSVLLTGRYQIHTGMQNGVLSPSMMFGLPLEFKLLPERLKELGYATHMVGKWHLGFYKKEYTPTYRGFDTFNGIYTGMADYYTKLYNNGYDFHLDEGNQLNVEWNVTEYSTTAFGRRATEVIEGHDQQKPLFLYVAFTAPHTPLQAPQEYLDLYSWVQDPIRQVNDAMVTCMDNEIGNIVDTLKRQGLYDNTVIVFSTDNGGSLPNGGSNWPLRAGKGTYYEGGIKSPGFVTGPLLERNGVTSDELIHISDWYPTLVHLAGGDTEGMELDGYNQWETINSGADNQREELLLNIDPLIPQSGGNLYPDIFDVRTQAGIRSGDWKLLTGAQANNGIREQPQLPDSNLNSRNKRQIVRNVQLFNISEDPTEASDLAEEHEEIVIQLLERLAFYNSTAVEAVNYLDLMDPDYDPNNNGGAHLPWK